VTNLPALPKTPRRGRRARGPQGRPRPRRDITTQATIPAMPAPRPSSRRAKTRDRRARAGARGLFASRRGDHVRAMRRRRRAMSQRARSSRGSRVSRMGFFRPNASRSIFGANVRRRDADAALLQKSLTPRRGFATRARPRRCCAPLKNTRCDAGAAPITASGSTTRFLIKDNHIAVAGRRNGRVARRQGF